MYLIGWIFSQLICLNQPWYERTRYKQISSITLCVYSVHGHNAPLLQMRQTVHVLQYKTIIISFEQELGRVVLEKVIE